MTDIIRLEGPGPFDLPVAQQVRVHKRTESVELIFIVENAEGQLVPVRVAVRNSEVVNLATHMARTATDQAF